MIMTIALYGLKTSAKALKLYFSTSFKEIGYKSCPVYLDIYMKAERDNNNNNKYLSYMLVYLNDYLCVYHELDPVMKDLKLRYKLIGDSFGAAN